MVLEVEQELVAMGEGHSVSEDIRIQIGCGDVSAVLAEQV